MSEEVPSDSADGDEAPKPDDDQGGGGTRRGSAQPKPIRDSVARGIDSLIESWFNQTAPGWSRKKRFFYALTGSSTFAIGILSAVTIQRSIFFESDLRVDWVVMLITGIVLLPGSLWFAWLVSWKDMKYGPIRLYLAGLSLPTTVWFALSKILIWG